MYQDYRYFDITPLKQENVYQYKKKKNCSVFRKRKNPSILMTSRK